MSTPDATHEAVSHQPHIPETEEPPVEYELLTGHHRTGGSYKNDEQLRSEYVHLTDDLVHKMTDGVDVYNEKTQQYEKRKPDAVIWLDKSARPVSWLARELWPTLAADADGNVPDMPDFWYVNIDREQWVNQIDPNGTGLMDINSVDQSVIRSLRSIFVRPEHKQAGLTEEIDSAATSLDGKTVLIIDEVRASGRTLDIAKKFFDRAFPDAKVAVTHWMKGLAVKEGATGNADLPVWYKEKEVKGRGVGNRDERLSQQSKSRTQRLGAWFLSTRLPAEALTDPITGDPVLDPETQKPIPIDRDPATTQLRRELHKLAEDVVAGQVLVVPSFDRGDYVERAERLNDLDFASFQEQKQRLDNSRPR